MFLFFIQKVERKLWDDFGGSSLKNQKCDFIKQINQNRSIFNQNRSMLVPKSSYLKYDSKSVKDYIICHVTAQFLGNILEQ